MTTLTEARLMPLTGTTPHNLISTGTMLFKTLGPVVCMLAPTITAESLQAGPTARMTMKVLLDRVALVVITIAPSAAIQYFLEGSGEEEARQ